MRNRSSRRPKRSLGQNFLIDPNLQRKIVDALDAGPTDEVLEIGPGRGALTRHLVGRVGRLVAVELDDALATALEEELGSDPSVEIVHGDVLDVDRAVILRDPSEARIVGNIPYNITTPIIFKLLERPRPASIVLMIQADVADRIVAEPGTRAYGALSVGVRTVASVTRLFGVGRRAFRPVPRVDSAVIRIEPHRPPRLTLEHEQRTRRLVRAAFQWRRKQLGRILRDHPDLGFPEAGVTEATRAVGVRTEDRPERLTPEQFVALAAALP